MFSHVTKFGQKKIKRNQKNQKKTFWVSNFFGYDG